MATKRTQTANPQEKAINQKQGPRTGNAGSTEKRTAFQKAKSTSSSEKSKLADFVIAALEGRGRGQAAEVNPALENMSPNSSKTTGIKKNATSDGARLPAKYKSPKSKG